MLYALDMVYLMGNQKEFDECLQFMRNQTFDWSNKDVALTIQEVTRILNALISAYEVSEQPIIKEKTLLFVDKIVMEFFVDQQSNDD